MRAGVSNVTSDEKRRLQLFAASQGYGAKFAKA